MEMDIEAGKDHIIILRRTEGSCSFGLSRLTHEREKSDDEFVQLAIDQGTTRVFGDSQAQYKLYNSNQAAVFFFENYESD